MKITFILLLTLFLAMTVLSQPAGIFVSAGGSVTARPYGRITVEAADNSQGMQHVPFSLESVALIRNDRDEVFISMNPLFTVFYFINPLFVLPQTFSNFRYQFNIYQESVQIVAGQNTDLYLFSKDKRIYTELFAGPKFTVQPFQFGVNGCFPLSKGFLKDRSPYIFAYVSYNIVQQVTPQ